MLPQEDQCQGGDAEVDTAHPAGDRAEQPARHPGQQHREHGREGGRQPRAGLTGQPYVAVGTHGQEKGVTEGELAGGAGQQAQAHRADGRRHREQSDAQPERVEVEGQGAQHDDGREGPAETDGAGAGESLRYGPPPFRRTARWAARAAPAPSPRRERRRRTPPPGCAGRTGSPRRAPRSGRSAGCPRGRRAARPIPPRIAAGNAFRAICPVVRSRPGAGNAARNTAARAASAPARHQARVRMRTSRTPIRAAASTSSAEARSDRPQDV
ncbi:hypothetical protein SVIOM74S_04151 [Streptomyces violarus]